MERPDHGYHPSMDCDALLARLGDDHLDRADLPVDLQPMVDEALLRGLVVEDCRDRLLRL